MDNGPKLSSEEWVSIPRTLWESQRKIATRRARLNRLRTIDAPKELIRREEELVQMAIDQVAFHPYNTDALRGNPF